MPPKRKNPPDNAAKPPAKRVTRSRGAAAPQPVPPPRAPRHQRVTKPAVEVESDDEDGPADAPSGPTRTTRSRAAIPATVKTKPKAARSTKAQKAIAEPPPLPKRGRPPTKKQPDAAKESASEPPAATSSKVTIEALHTADDDSEPDELLLTAPKKALARPATPPRKSAATATKGTPRMILDAVEVPTPSKKMRDIQNIVSPRVTSPAKASSVKRFPQRETTPTRPKTSVQTSSVLPSLHRSRTEDAASPPPSPKPLPTTPAKSPRKRAAPQISPSRLPRALPSHLYPALNAQKRATLKALHEISVLPQGDSEDDDNTEPSANTAAFNQLCGLLTGTVERGEGNSCMVIGPKGSGKTQLVERAISTLPDSPIVIRLSGFAQTNDRLAIREIAWQLAEQTGQSLLPPEQDETAQDDENPFIEPNAEVAVTLPPPSHLLALISMLPTLPRPTIITLDGFDLFALHARQSLLYCLLDTVQSCRAVSGNRGIAIVGVTTRVETINILEKRVKSRFSGRIIRTAGLSLFDSWIGAARHALCSPIQDESEYDWSNMWNASVDSFLHDQQVIRLLKETFTLTKDIRVLGRFLVATVIALKPSSPALSTSEFAAAVNKQRYPPRFSFLSSLTYPSICLLIAAAHVRTSGHETFTFEMLHDAFQDQVRISMSAPVTVDGGGIGMVRCSRDVLFGAFEKLVSLQVFVATASATAGTGKEFMKYRCDADRSEIKGVVDKTGQLSLKKWLTKAQ